MKKPERRNALNSLFMGINEINVGYKHSNGKCHGRLKLRIQELTSVHEATEPEIEQVYNHILMEMLK